jgi:hypothetical protein
VNVKVAVVILVVIVVLFIVGVTTGALHSDNKLSNDFAKSLPGSLANVQPVDLRDVSGSPGGCVSGGRLVVLAPGTCVYTIKAANPPIRRLRMTSGIATISIHFGDRRMSDQQDTFAAGTDKDKLDVYSAGATVTVACTFGQCVFVPSGN